MDRQFRVTDDVCEQHMGDFQLNFLFNLSSHLDSHGNARREDTLKQATESRAQSWPAKHSIRFNKRNLPYFAYWDFATARMIIPHIASGVNDLMAAMRNCDSVIFYSKSRDATGPFCQLYLGISSIGRWAVHLLTREGDGGRQVNGIETIRR